MSEISDIQINQDSNVLGKVIKLDETTVDVPLEKQTFSKVKPKGEREGVEPPAKKVRTEKQIQHFEKIKKIRAEKIEQRKLEKMKLLIEKGMIKAIPENKDDDEEEEEEVVVVKKKSQKDKPKKKKVIIVESESEESEEEDVKVSPHKVFKSQRNKKTKVVSLEIKPEPKPKTPIIKNYFAD